MLPKKIHVKDLKLTHAKVIAVEITVKETHVKTLLKNVSKTHVKMVLKNLKLLLVKIPLKIIRTNVKGIHQTMKILVKDQTLKHGLKTDKNMNLSK